VTEKPMKRISPEFCRLYEDLQRNNGIKASFIDYSREAARLLRTQQDDLGKMLTERKNPTGRKKHVITWYGMDFKF
jgi:hypothetical protein